MKTLKDLFDLEIIKNCPCGGVTWCSHCDVNKVREAAKEWVKWLKGIHLDCDGGIDEDNWPEKRNCPHWYECDDSYYSHCGCHTWANNRIEWIKHFFNLNEEEE